MTRASNESDRDFISGLVKSYVDRFPWVDPLAIEVFARMGAVASARSAVYSRFFRSRGMERTAGRFALLRVLYFGADKPMALSELSTCLDVTPANVTTLVDGLEGDGLVTRVPHESDRRSTLVRLTDSGMQLCEELVPGLADLHDQICSGFTDEEKLMVIEAMKRIKANSDAAFRE